MNKKQRQEYAARHERKIRRFERMHLRPVYATLQKYAAVVAERVRAGDAPWPAGEIMVPDLAVAISDIHTTVGVAFARQTVREVARSVKEVKAGFSLNEVWIKAIIQHFSLYLLNKAVLPITRTLQGAITEVINRGVEEGWSIDRMAFEITHDKKILYIARRAVRTEIVMAQNYGKQLGEKENAFESDKIWIAARDFRTRHSHRDIDGERTRFENKFAVTRYKGKLPVGTDMMDGPGDPTASAGNIINCRCTIAVRAARDENGRLIRKNKLLLQRTSATSP